MHRCLYPLGSILLASAVALAGWLALGQPVQATASRGPLVPAAINKTYTLDADFDQGVLVNITHTVANQLQLNAQLTTFRFIWVPASSRGTVLKIDTLTGQILGEYRTAPAGRATNPSRTTVDMKGSVWVGNRDESAGSMGSATHIGLQENSQCVDRNRNGVIDTSTGLGDVKPWTNLGQADDSGGVSTAADECILHYVRVPGTNVRHISVDRANNAWIGGYARKVFSLVDGSTGQVLRSLGPFACGGYGGLVDSAGVVWSADFNAHPLRLDPVTGQGTCLNAIPNTNYGMGLDGSGNIWLARWWENQIYKLLPDGSVAPGYPKNSGATTPRGVSVDPAGDIWIAHSGSNNLARLGGDGLVKNLISLSGCSYPIGVAVDAAGKVWVPCLNSDNVVRVDPASNGVDLTVSLGAGAGPYSYSDMTGSVALGRTAPQGTWTVVFDSGQAATPWGTLSWNGSEPSGSSLGVRARSAESSAGLGTAAYLTVTSGLDFDPPNGRYLQIEVTFRPGAGGVSPVLNDLTLQTSPPTCVLVNDKTVAPGAVQAGGVTTITLSLHADGACTALDSPVDVALVLDRSGSMAGANLTQAKTAAQAFVAQMNLTVDQVAVVSFGSTGAGQLNLPLTRTASVINAAISSLVASGMTNVKEGLVLAENELIGARHQSASAPVIILLSDGRHNETVVGDLLATADRIRGRGIRLITVGLGPEADADQLRALASSATDYYYAPSAADLAGIYQAIAPTVRTAGRSLILTDTLDSGVQLVSGSFQGPVQPSVSGRSLIYQLNAVPVSPISLTYQMAVTSTPGAWYVNESAAATYIDSLGRQSSLTFPRPYVVVPAVCQTPEVDALQPAWAFAASGLAARVSGSGFFTQTDFSAITGTFSVKVYAGAQPLSIWDWSRDSLSATLAAAALPPGVYDVSVVNTCAFTPTLPVDPYSGTLPLPPLPTQVYTGVLPGGLTLYPPTRITSVTPAESYGDVPADILVCGQGLAPGTLLYIDDLSGPLLLSDQAPAGPGCIGGTVPANLVPGAHSLTAHSACCDASAPFRVLDPSLNDDLWALDSEIWISPSLTPHSDESITLGAAVSRRGGKDPISNLVVAFYEDVITPSRRIGDGIIPLLPPRVGGIERISGTSTSAVPWVPSRGVTTYTLYAVIDPANAVTEDIEVNNIYSRTVRILPAAGVDRVAPRVDALTLGSWPAGVTNTTVYTRSLALGFTATDFAQPGASPSGVARMNFVEYLFLPPISKWVPVAASGWVHYTPSLTLTRSYNLTLSPSGGQRVIQAWAADGAGKVSRYPNWKTVNYAPPCTPISRYATHVYRQTVQAGDVLRVELSPCSGDVDLFVWPPDWGDGQPPYVSNQAGSLVESLEITIDGAVNRTAGVYEIEVYAFSTGRYTLEIEVERAAAAPHLLGAQAVRSAGVDPAKPLPAAPVLPERSQPPITDGVPPVEPPPPEAPAHYDLYLPYVKRQ